ncbi:CBM20 domain-containing protein [Clostridium neuense]|uniref:CBM20 domain-containing protein n=1 Tax=Clostridium neuense TaxID=1728934 RepID=A0ABW8TGZ5_9CLOT
MKKSNVKKSTSTKISSSKPENTSIKKAVGTSIVKSSSDETKNISETKEKNTVTLSKTSCETHKSTAHETKKKSDTKKTTIEFTFKVNNKTSYFGEKLYVCGSIKELGNWDVKNAFALNTDENLYPSWKGTITLPVDTYIEFKFVSVGNDGTTENVIWEDGENRAATITKESDNYESDWNETK